MIWQVFVRRWLDGYDYDDDDDDDAGVDCPDLESALARARELCATLADDACEVVIARKP